MSSILFFLVIVLHATLFENRKEFTMRMTSFREDLDYAGDTSLLSRLDQMALDFEGETNRIDLKINMKETKIAGKLVASRAPGAEQ